MVPKPIKCLMSLLVLSGAMISCGKGDSSTTDANGAGSALVNVTGSVRSVSGGQTEMANWSVVFLERDSGLCKVAKVDAIGKYELNGLRTGKAQTTLLLDTNFRLASVLTYPGTVAGSVRQFYTVSGNVIPPLVQNGPTISFGNTNPLTWEKDLAADADLDGIPDGMEPSTAGLFLADVDTDSDKIPNQSDADIDGDGIPNWFDTDDNGNGYLDIFDNDANGDLVVDALQSNSELFYGIGIEYFIVQVAQEVVENELTTRLIFTTRVRDGEAPTTVGIRGPDSLFEGANAELTSAETGAIILQTWDRTLADDGLNEDGGASDKLFTRKVLLGTGKTLRSNQVVFAELTYGSGATAISFNYPYIFPNLTTGVVSGSYAEATRVMTMTGTPFVDVTSYTWSVNIYDSSGKKIFSSEQIPNTSTTYTIPDDALESGESYTAHIIASSTARVPGYPAWFIKSAAISL